MKNILFVDDETKILQSMKRGMIAYKSEWRTFLASDAQVALDIIAEKDIDVVITDVIMPGVNGVEFLEKVSVLSPKTIRVVLSGQVEEGMILSCVRVAHLVFSKPSGIDVIMAQVERILDNDFFITDERFVKVLRGMSIMPSIPDTLVKLNEYVGNKSSSVDDVISVIINDPCVCAGILKLANSPFYGLRDQVLDLKRAVSLLGFETVRAYVASIYFEKFYLDYHIDKEFLENFREHSKRVAGIALMLGDELGFSEKEKELAFSASLLHDSGVLIMLANFGASYESAMKESIKNKEPIWHIEKKNIGITHAEAAAYLFSLWRLPQELVDSILFHHTPALSRTDDTRTVVATYLANIFDHLLYTKSERYFDDLDAKYLSRFDFGSNIEELIERWLKLIKEAISNG